MAKEKKITSLEELDKMINKEFGDNSIIKLDGTVTYKPEMYSTDIPGLDYILGGGFGKGRHIEIYGPNSAGKTTIALHAIKAVQDKGNTVCFVDVEHAFDASYAENLGLDLPNLRLVKPKTAEIALDISQKLAESNLYDMIVIDSVSALVPQAEAEADMGSASMGLQARLMAKGLRKVTGICEQNGTTVIWLNQIRMKIGILFGSPETRSGGESLKYYASQILDVRRIETINEGNKDSESIANRIRITVKKNKLAPPNRKCELIINFGEGIDIFANVVEMAVQYGFVNKAGSWYSYGDEKIGQGLKNVITFMEDNPDIYSKIKEQVDKEVAIRACSTEVSRKKRQRRITNTDSNSKVETKVEDKTTKDKDSNSKQGD